MHHPLGFRRRSKQDSRPPLQVRTETNAKTTRCCRRVALCSKIQGGCATAANNKKAPSSHSLFPVVLPPLLCWVRLKVKARAPQTVVTPQPRNSQIIIIIMDTCVTPPSKHAPVSLTIAITTPRKQVAGKPIHNNSKRTNHRKRKQAKTYHHELPQPQELQASHEILINTHPEHAKGKRGGHFDSYSFRTAVLHAWGSSDTQTFKTTFDVGYEVVTACHQTFRPPKRESGRGDYLPIKLLAPFSLPSRHHATTTSGDLGDFFPLATSLASSLSSNCLIMPPRDLALVIQTPMIPTRIAARYGVDAESDPRDTIRTWSGYRSGTAGG